MHNGPPPFVERYATYRTFFKCVYSSYGAIERWPRQGLPPQRAHQRPRRGSKIQKKRKLVFAKSSILVSFCPWFKSNSRSRPPSMVRSKEAIDSSRSHAPETPTYRSAGVGRSEVAKVAVFNIAHFRPFCPWCVLYARRDRNRQHQWFNQ